MAEVSILGNVIVFLGKIGVFDVILPFLLVFSIIYAILEKTRVFGMEKIGKNEYSRKNINAMVAFVIGFFVIASSQLVGIVTAVSSQMVVLLFLAVFFLLLVGTFYGEGEIGAKGLKKQKKFRTAFIWIMFVGIIGIFLQAIKTKNGDSWLEYILYFLKNNWSSTAVASIILIALMIGFVIYVTAAPKPDKKPNDGDDE